MVVNRVAGNFHFALTHEEHTTLMAVFGQREALNVSHTIHSVSFGEWLWLTHHPIPHESDWLNHPPPSTVADSTPPIHTVRAHTAHTVSGGG